MKSKLASLSAHTFPSQKMGETLSLISPTIVKISVSPITKHLKIWCI